MLQENGWISSSHHYQTTTSQMDVLPKRFFKVQTILAAEWLVQHSKVRPPTSSDDLRLLFGPTLFRMVTHSVAYLYSHLYKDNSLCLTWKLNKGGLLQMESLVSCPFQSNHLQTLDIKKENLLMELKWNGNNKLQKVPFQSFHDAFAGASNKIFF